ncbi:MAG: DUF4974 domain-containing protein [Chitinophagaceae bacterium]|nr:MAG: DUF4974 domain-containing protein [Chitinophagaceae bacterium]
MLATRLEILFKKYITDQINSSELIELQQLVQDKSYENTIDEILDKLYTDSSLRTENDFDQKEIFKEISTRIQSNNFIISSKSKIKKLYQWASAVAAVLVLLMGVYYLFYNSQPRKIVEKQTDFAQKDIKAPETNRATVTMADGTVVYLDSIADGQLATQGNVRLVKLADGKISYEIVDQSLTVASIPQNTVSNPKGSKAINITLSDGSKVWLNAGSSITYPVIFTEAERTVTLKGEGYFEVAHIVDTKGVLQKFVVAANQTQTEVLGTHFNINAYDDEAAVRVTLLEGKVNVLSGVNKMRLAPGQQAKVQGESISLNRNVNIDEVMAWKSGSFYFEKADLGEVVRQLARWYDLDVVFKGNIPKRNFEGEMQKDLSLKQALKILENNQINFKLEGRTIYIMP